MSPAVFAKLLKALSLPEDADELDLLIAVTKLVAKQPLTTLPNTIRDARPKPFRPDFDRPA